MRFAVKARLGSLLVLAGSSQGAWCAILHLVALDHQEALCGLERPSLAYRLPGFVAAEHWALMIIRQKRSGVNSVAPHPAFPKTASTSGNLIMLGPNRQPPADLPGVKAAWFCTRTSHLLAFGHPVATSTRSFCTQHSVHQVPRAALRPYREAPW